METVDHFGVGKGLILTSSDSLNDVPDSHQDIITDEIERAFDDPIKYFRGVAERCRFVNMAKWLKAVTASGEWQLMLDEADLPDRCTNGGFRFRTDGIASGIVAPSINVDVEHDFEPFTHYYSLVDEVRWELFPNGGHLWGQWRVHPNGCF